ncbi:MAG: purine-binding chemotaxis protein CheW [Deltaproteobacteria bacterium]|nr:purine-binding chemotaxis protein CheW [Deltaproteobacteria bacterium]
MTVADSVAEIAPAASEKAGKYLTFSLADEEYGIGILKVREIIGMMPITPVPQTPDFVKGVINLRGKVIPVLDLRKKFGMKAIEHTDRTCIIVVEFNGESSSTIMGSMVDSVSEVLNIKGEEIEPTPAFGTKLNTDYILGIAKIDGGVKILLDIDRVLGQQELALCGLAEEGSFPLPSSPSSEQSEVPVND